LAGLYAYVAEANPAAAAELLTGIDRKVASLASSENSGVARGWLWPRLRALPYRNRCIYFLVLDDRLQIVRVLHGRQDVNAEMFSPDVED
jgi:toxin ParE1/3/4